VLAEMMTITSTTLAATMFADTLPPLVLRQALDDLTTLLAGIYRRMLIPPPLDRLPTPGNRRYHQARTRLRQTLTELITRRRASNTDRNDLLSALLSARDGDREGGSQGLSDTEIADQAVTFFAAGAESTATAVAWALHLLTQHPDIYDRLHTEVDTVLAGRPATHADVPRLDLTHRVITETLRLWPPAWMFTRTVTADTQLGEHHLPAGTTIVYSPYLLHRHPGLYERPDRFDPDRWLPDRSQGLHRDAFIPFGAGARKCIGDTFALTEAILALATVTTRWHLHPLPDQQVRPAPVATLRPKNLRLRGLDRTPRHAGDLTLDGCGNAVSRSSPAPPAAAPRSTSSRSLRKWLRRWTASLTRSGSRSWAVSLTGRLKPAKRTWASPPGTARDRSSCAARSSPPSPIVHTLVEHALNIAEQPARAHNGQP
jgi:cytochrome P450